MVEKNKRTEQHEDRLIRDRITVFENQTQKLLSTDKHFNFLLCTTIMISFLDCRQFGMYKDGLIWGNYDWKLLIITTRAKEKNEDTHMRMMMSAETRTMTKSITTKQKLHT